MWHNTRPTQYDCLRALCAGGARHIGVGGRAGPRSARCSRSTRSGSTATPSTSMRWTVRRALLDHLKGNFFTVNLDTARAAFESMPWVRHASVRRIWPDRIAVDLDEYQPLATWGDDPDGQRSTASLFTANQGEVEGELPAFEGPEGSERGRSWRAIATSRSGSRRCTRSPSRSTCRRANAWTVKLSQRTADRVRPRAQCADAREPRAALRFVVGPDDAALGQGISRYADLRYPNGFAVRSASVQIADDPAAAAARAAAEREAGHERRREAGCKTGRETGAEVGPRGRPRPRRRARVNGASGSNATGKSSANPPSTGSNNRNSEKTTGTGNTVPKQQGATQ